MADVTLAHIESISNNLTDKLAKMRSIVLYISEENKEVVELLMQFIKTHDKWLHENMGHPS